MSKKIIIAIFVISSFALTSSAQTGNCNTSTLLGSIIGAAIGYQAKNHTDAAMGVGALLGGSIANDSCEKNRVVQDQQFDIYPQPRYGGSYTQPSCQIVSQVFFDGYGGYYTQWQEICN